MGINIEKPDFDKPREQEGFRAQRAGLGHQAGAERLGLSLWEVAPDRRRTRTTRTSPRKRWWWCWPAGRACARPVGEMEQGEVVAFPRGEAGRIRS